MTNIRAVAFDLGNTLAAYYERDEFPQILERSIRAAYPILAGLASAPVDQALSIAFARNKERTDGKVRPLQERLNEIFGLRQTPPDGVQHQAACAFLQPIFDRARPYSDSSSMLHKLRSDGYKLAIVSNSPWGSPSSLWREELARLGFSKQVDHSIFCGDVGWRKPARAIFDHLLQKLDVEAGECLFVGDEPVWDIEGAEAAGLRAVLIDRTNRRSSYQGARIQTLEELAKLLEQ